MGRKKTTTAGTNGHRNGAVLDDIDRVARRIEDDHAEQQQDDHDMAVVVPERNWQEVAVTVRGVTPLLICRFSAKAKRQMLEGMQEEAGKEKKERPPLDPLEEFEGLRYREKDAGWDGINILSFKGAMVEACRQFRGLPMTKAKQLVRIEAEGYDEDGTPLARILGPAPTVFDHPVRIGKGSNKTAMPRFRPMFFPWTVHLRIKFNATVFKPQHLINLLAFAGDGGVGDWRPSSPNNNCGSYGVFEIVATRE
jgi:hypothetical protein